MAKEKVLNPDAPFDTVHGEPGVKYMQNGSYFSPTGEYIRTDPPSVAAQKTTVPEKNGKPGKSVGTLKLPDPQGEVMKENFAAKNAEDKSWVD